MINITGNNLQGYVVHSSNFYSKFVIQVYYSSSSCDKLMISVTFSSAVKTGLKLAGLGGLEHLEEDEDKKPFACDYTGCNKRYVKQSHLEVCIFFDFFVVHEDHQSKSSVPLQLCTTIILLSK